MERNDKLRSYYLDDMNEIEDFDLDNILIDEKLYENIIVYNISHKSLIHPKRLDSIKYLDQRLDSIK